MKLHENSIEFATFIENTAEHFGIQRTLIEKDYYLSILLKKIKEKYPNIVFKGGTSLSKCHKIIKRFSEDIDLTLDENFFTQSQKRLLKKSIVDACNELGLEVVNIKHIQSRRKFNRYRIKYPVLYPNQFIDSTILLETAYIEKSYPTEVKTMNSFIGELAYLRKDIDSIETFELQPFEIQVQSLSRTLVDKVFAICDYKMSGVVRRHSRHLYDIYKLLPQVELDDSLKCLIEEVRIARRSSSKSLSAQKGINVNKILKEIIETNYYKEDYDKNTFNLVFDQVKYEETLIAIQKIIDSGVFD